MSELLQKILNDSSARDAVDMPVLASNMTDDFLPWGGEE